MLIQVNYRRYDPKVRDKFLKILQLLFEDRKHPLLYLQRLVMPELGIPELDDMLGCHIVLSAFGNIFQIIVDLSIGALALVVFFKASIKFLMICVFQIIKNVISADKYKDKTVLSRKNQEMFTVLIYGKHIKNKDTETLEIL